MYCLARNLFDSYVSAFTVEHIEWCRISRIIVMNSWTGGLGVRLERQISGAEKCVGKSHYRWWWSFSLKSLYWKYQTKTIQFGTEIVPLKLMKETREEYRFLPPKSSQFGAFGSQFWIGGTAINVNVIRKSWISHYNYIRTSPPIMTVILCRLWSMLL